MLPGACCPGMGTFLSRWTGCDSEGEVVVRGKQVRRKLGRSWTGPVGILPLNFVVTPCACFEKRLVSNVPLCLCIVSEDRKEARASF